MLACYKYVLLYGIMNKVYDDIPKDLLKLVEDVVLNKHPNATGTLLVILAMTRGSVGICG